VSSLDPGIRTISMANPTDTGEARARGHARTPDAARVEIQLEGGTPTAVNGVPMGLVDLMDSLETIAGCPREVVMQAAYAAPGALDAPVTTVCLKVTGGHIEQVAVAAGL
jgi:hypothetical protein